MSNDTALPAEQKDVPPAFIPRRYWIAILLPLLLGGIAIGVNRVRSSDASLRERLVGKWIIAECDQLDLRPDGTFTWVNDAVFSGDGLFSLDGVWLVEDGHLVLKPTHASNTFTDMLSSPGEWLGYKDGVFSPKRDTVVFLDNNHIRLKRCMARRLRAESP